MYGRYLQRCTIAAIVALASMAHAATYSVSSLSSCQAIPGATWGSGSVCTLGANVTLATGDALAVSWPASLRVPAGVTLANNGGLLHVRTSAKLLVSGGAILHLAGTIDNDGLWEIRGESSIVVTSPDSLTDSSNEIQLLEGRFDNYGRFNHSYFASFLTVGSAGVLRNFGQLVNVAGADIFSRGRIENAGSIANHGVIENRCGAFLNTGSYAGQAVVTPHCWIGGTGDLWSSPASWSQGVVPAADAYVVLPSGTATLDTSLVHFGTLLLEGGHLVVAPDVTFDNRRFVSLAGASPGASTLRNRGTFINRATLENGNRFINEGAFSNLAVVRAGSSPGTFVNSGTWVNQSVTSSISAQAIDNAPGGTMANHGTMQLTLVQSHNAGTLTNHSGAVLSVTSRLRNRQGGSLSNDGRLLVNPPLATPGGIDNEAGATVHNRSGGSLSLTSAAAHVNNAGLVRNDGALANSGTFNNTGAVCGTGTLSGNALVGNAPVPVCLPIANAGADQSVDEATQVMLDGTASSTTNGTPLAYLWTQTAGPVVALNTANPARPTFTAPDVAATTVLSFELVVNDGFGSSAADFVEVTVTSSNTPPVADAGDDRSAKAGTVVTLDGSHSYDPDGTAIAGHEWTQVSGPAVALVPGAHTASPSFTVPAAGAATLVFKLRVFDGKEWSVPSAGEDPARADTVAVTVVENSRPVAMAGADRVVPEHSLVVLDGSASRDSDSGDVLGYAWRQVAGPAVVLDNAASATASFAAPDVGPGGAVLTFELVVRDDDPVNPLSSSDTVSVAVSNLNDPPRCDVASPSEATLWPPDSKMSTVGITGVADDGASGLPLTLRITGVRQDEPVSGLTPGDPAPDAVIVAGQPADTVQLRRERSGRGNGRVYTIAFTAHDGLASCSGTVKVEVPHSRNGAPAVDDGTTFDSTGG